METKQTPEDSTNTGFQYLISNAYDWCKRFAKAVLDDDRINIAFYDGKFTGAYYALTAIDREDVANRLRASYNKGRRAVPNYNG